MKKNIINIGVSLYVVVYLVLLILETSFHVFDEKSQKYFSFFSKYGFLLVFVGMYFKNRLEKNKTKKDETTP